VAAAGFEVVADSLTQERRRYRICPPKSLRTELQDQFHERNAKPVGVVHVRPFVFVK
jgi:hypothetical protein